MEDNPENLIRKANSKLSPGFFGKLFSNEQVRAEEACQLYESAANLYKIQKNWEEAGKAYEKCAELDIKTNMDPSQHYREASHCFSFTNKERSIKNLENCIKSYEKKGKYQQAGKVTQEMAHDLEVDLDYEKAIEKYKLAADYYAMESKNTKSSEQACLIKQADLMCISNHKEMLEKAPGIYEKVGMEYLTVPLLKSSAKDLFFKCVVLFLIKKDDVTAEIYLNKFLEEDPTFDDTREVKFLREAIRCVSEPPDPDGFRKAVADFKQYRDLDKWKLNMFAAILKGIEVADDDFK